ncbi:MAG TPA: hypothetical protein VGB18_02615, partial [Candidatus Thermoplasmatota archaeon]
PSLLYIKLNVTQRLQTSAQVPGAELAQHTALLLLLQELEQLDAETRAVTVRSITTGLDQLTFLRQRHETIDDAHIADNRALLLRAEDTMLILYMFRAEQFSAQGNRTQERLELLEGAMNAAETIHDASSFARLSQTHTRLHSRYEADITDAAARRDRVGFLLSNPVPVLNPAFPSFYSDLLNSVQALPGARDRYAAHGETENVDAVRSLEASGTDYAQRYGIVAAGVLAVWALLWIVIAAVGLARIRRWAYDHRHAGLGDELGADV